MDQAQVSLPENIMDVAQVSILENANLKFLMPSRRHHPQVEPLLATYKICYTKRWLNLFWSLQGKNFIAKSVGSWRLLKVSCLCPKSSLLCPFYTLEFRWFHERLLQNHHFSPPSTSKTNLIYTPLFSIKILHFHIFPLFPSIETPVIRFKTPSLPYQNPQNH